MLALAAFAASMMLALSCGPHDLGSLGPLHPSMGGSGAVPGDDFAGTLGVVPMLNAGQGGGTTGQTDGGAPSAGGDDAAGAGGSQEPACGPITASYWPTPAKFLLKPGSIGETLWRYVALSPDLMTWMLPSFDDSSWALGSPGFFLGRKLSSDSQRTPWPASTNAIWLRTTFELPKDEIATVLFWARWQDGLAVYVNGVPAIEELAPSTGYRYLGMSDAARKALVAGTNTLAVRVTVAGLGTLDRYFDLGVTTNAELARGRPSTGFEHSKPLEALTSLVESYMTEHGIGAGQLALMKDDNVVLSRALGWQDATLCLPLSENAPFRLGANDHFISVGGVRRMLDEGVKDPKTGTPLSESTHVFTFLEAQGLKPVPMHDPSTLAADVTLGDLLSATAGLGSLPYGPDFYSGLGKQPGEEIPEDDVRWLLSGSMFGSGVPDADDTSAIVLRYLIRVLHGDPLAYLNQLEPEDPPALVRAHARPGDRAPLEPWYAAFDEPPDRWLTLENADSLAASSLSLVRYLRSHDLLSGAPLFDPKTQAWVGSDGDDERAARMPGSFNWLWQRRTDRITVALSFNLDGDYGDLTSQLRQLTSTISDFGP